MGKHKIGKWARGEVTEAGQKKKKQVGMSFYKGSASAICFFCGEQHLFMYPCGQLEEYQRSHGIEIRDPADISG